MRTMSTKGEFNFAITSFGGDNLLIAGNLRHKQTRICTFACSKTCYVFYTTFARPFDEARELRIVQW